MKNIYAEITNFVAEYHDKKLTEKLLRHCEQESKSTEARAKDNFEKKLEWFKESWMVKKPNQKPQNLPMKETINIKSKKEKITVNKNQNKKRKMKKKHQAIS